MKIQFGSGGNRLDGWTNTDLPQVDISKPLPFPALCADFVLAEHVIEHVSQREGWLFLVEVMRILKPGGVLRLSFPDIVRLSVTCDREYMAAAKHDSVEGCLEACMFEHGHEALWSKDLMEQVLKTIGFSVEGAFYGVSSHPELHGVDGHGKVVGCNIAIAETTILEATK